MANITMVKIRAKIDIGSNISIETPYIQSFNVNISRGRVGSFNASLKVKGQVLGGSTAGEGVRIYAGEGSPNNLIFVGTIKAAKISPCFDDPSFVLLSISGVDIMYKLQGKKYIRRYRAVKACWCSIESVVRRGLKSGKFKYKADEFLLTSTAEPADTQGLMHTNTMHFAELLKSTSGSDTKNTQVDGVPLTVSNAGTTINQ